MGNKRIPVHLRRRYEMNTLKKKMLAQAVPVLAKEERIKKAASSADGVHESAGGQQKDSE